MEWSKDESKVKLQSNLNGCCKLVYARFEGESRVRQPPIVSLLETFVSISVVRNNLVGVDLPAMPLQTAVIRHSSHAFTTVVLQLKRPVITILRE